MEARSGNVNLNRGLLECCDGRSRSLLCASELREGRLGGCNGIAIVCARGLEGLVALRHGLELSLVSNELGLCDRMRKRVKVLLLLDDICRQVRFVGTSFNSTYTDYSRPLSGDWRPLVGPLQHCRQRAAFRASCCSLSGQ